MVKVSILSIGLHAIYKFKCNSYQIVSKIFVDINKPISKFLWRDTGPRIAKTIFHKKSKVRGITLPNVKAHYIATVTRRVWYRWKDGHIEQWDRIENPEIYPHKYAQLTFDKGTKVIQQRKDSFFNKWCQSNWRDRQTNEPGPETSHLIQKLTQNGSRP